VAVLRLRLLRCPDASILEHGIGNVWAPQILECWTGLLQSCIYCHYSPGFYSWRVHIACSNAGLRVWRVFYTSVFYVASRHNCSSAVASGSAVPATSCLALQLEGCCLLWPVAALLARVLGAGASIGTFDKEQEYGRR
jgi:hypothetical protein